MSESRTGKRFPLKLPITLHSHKKSAKKHKGTTTNVSAAGVFMQADTELEVGSTVRFDITLPPDVLGTKTAVKIRCTGRVVRSEAPARGKARSKRRVAKGGLACVIDDYEFTRGKTSR